MKRFIKNNVSLLFNQLIEIMHKIAPYIDHSILKPDTTSEQIKQLCQEAMTHSS